jgi:hypothetical protein
VTIDEPDARPVRDQYAAELRADPFYLPGVDDYDSGWVNETDDEETTS